MRAVDLVLSPTQFLAGVLRDGGVEAPLEVEPCGIDLSPFEGLERATRALGEPLRVAFLGGVSKHKGLHDLLEASAGLDGVALRVHGASSDRAYSERCRALAEAAGADWCGPFTHEELPLILADTDVVVVPSKWPENAPFVIREAFAAGVPVIAADVGAMRESVRDGVDGWLYPAGDVAALSASLRRLVREHVEWQVETPRSVDQQAAALIKRYSELAPTTTEGPRARLEHLEGLTRALEAAGDMSWRDLVDSALSGYERLCAELSPGEAGARRLTSALTTGSKLGERLAEGERARAWLGQTVDATRRSEEELDAPEVEDEPPERPKNEPRDLWRGEPAALICTVKIMQVRGAHAFIRLFACNHARRFITRTWTKSSGPQRTSFSFTMQKLHGPEPSASH